MKVNSNDWHKSFHDRDLVETQRLSAAERGVYYTIRNLIFRELGHTSNDDVSLSAWCRITPRKFATVKAHLLKLKLLYVDNTSLRSPSADKIIAERMAKRRKASKSGKAGGLAKAARERTKANPRAKPHTEPHAGTGADETPQLFEHKGHSSERYTGDDQETGGKPAVNRQPADRISKKTPGGKPRKPLKNNKTPLANATNPLAESKSLRTEEGREGSKTLVAGEADDFTADAVAEAFDTFNAIAGDGNDWPKADARTPKRKKLLGKLLNTEGTGGLTGWRAMLTRASESDWLSGRSPRGAGHENWRASLDYFARLDVFVEVVEGRHDNRRAITADGNRSKRGGAAALGEALKRFVEEDAG